MALSMPLTAWSGIERALETSRAQACAGCCSVISPKQGGYTFRFEDTKWDRTAKRVEWTCPYKQILFDLDGTLTGHKFGTATPYYKFNEWPDLGCTKRNATFDDGIVCDGQFGGFVRDFEVAHLRNRLPASDSNTVGGRGLFRCGQPDPQPRLPNSPPQSPIWGLWRRWRQACGGSCRRCFATFATKRNQLQPDGSAEMLTHLSDP
jgi:hypothetical protein